MNKEIRLNIRVKPDFKADLEAVAEYHGLTVSSYVHSVLIKKIREEKDSDPRAFEAIKAVKPQNESLNYSGKDKRVNAEKEAALERELKKYDKE